MRSLEDYLNAARENGDFKSDKKLCDAIGIKNASMSAYRQGKALPTDKQMVSIAELAGLDPEVAILEVGFWRSAQRADIKSATIYRQILEKMTGAAAAIALVLMLFTVTGKNSSQNGNNLASRQFRVSSIYYVK